MPKKMRLDQMLVDRGLVESRTRAQALVMAGLVFSGEQKLAKPGQQLSVDAPLDVRGRDHPWVSRGGIKLAHAIEHFALDPSGARLVKSFGVYSGARTYASYEIGQLRDIVASHELLYYRDGATATVAVQQIESFRLLKINGKTDASNGPGDVATQLLLGHLPYLLKDAKRVGVIGWGSGMTVGAVLQHPVELVDAFEIEPAVIEASRYFEPINGRPLDDDRLHLVIGDARGELRRDVEPYDVIISEPSNPWITGVANLFTRDFFELTASRLAPGGVFAQWFHLYGMSEDSAREVMATFRSVFPHVVAFNDRDLILLGSDRPITFSLDQMTRRFADPGVRASLAEAFVRSPADLLVKLRLDERGTAAFAAGAALNTDDNMRLELAAPRTLYQDRLAAIRTELDRHPPAPLDLVTGYGSLQLFHNQGDGTFLEVHAQAELKSRSWSRLDWCDATAPRWS